MNRTSTRSGRGDPSANRRSGFILAVVTVAIVLLALAAYNYSGTMLVEHEAAAMGGRDVVARTAAESAIEFAAVRIAERDLDDSVNLYHDTEAFRGRLLMDSTVDRGRVRWSVVAYNESSEQDGGIRFGLASENAKLNLNTLLVLDQLEQALPEEEKTGLVYETAANIPGMTDAIVDGILDWLDSDDDRRPYGAESADYESLTVPYSAKNGPMQSIDELLKVQGVTPDLFYGEDRNHNGQLDGDEDTNQDGMLTPGWKDYLTAVSRERNSAPDGTEKINLNMSEMTTLYDSIESEFGEEAASFVVAYRLGGTEYAQDALPGKSDSGIEEKISRNGIDLTKVPKFRFTSIYELVDGETNSVAMAEGGNESFTSPWTADVNTILTVFPELEQALTTNDNAFIEGRININQARREVLFAIPNMPEDVPDAIIAARPPADLTVASSSIMAQRNTAAWILAEGLVDLPTLRDLGPYITTGGDIFRLQAVGHFDAGGPTTRLEAMIDATESPPRVRFVRDLTLLGRGYHPSLLTGNGPADSTR